MKNAALIFITLVLTTGSVMAQQVRVQERMEGLLMGAFIGDAAGGPPEFQTPVRSQWVTRGKPLDGEAIQALGRLYSMKAYNRKAEPYAHWVDFAPAGTITDDSRHKIMFLEAVKKASKTDRRVFAQTMIEWYESDEERYKSIREEALREYVKAAYWETGDTQKGLPLQRLWGGIPTQAGQMFLLPIAGIHPGEPEKAYRAAYEVNFVDIGIAKDINAALAAGLSAALHPEADWAYIEKNMRETDPYDFAKVPWVERRFEYWLNKAQFLAKESGGDPQKLFKLLEENLETRQWWDAWVPHTVFFAIAEITGYDPLATLQLINEFGYDTDSYAQLGGAFFGALHGAEVFPKEMRDLVRLRLKEQFDISFDDLVAVMIQAQGK